MTSLLHAYRRRAWAASLRPLTSQFGVVILSRYAAVGRPAVASRRRRSLRTMRAW